jgi:hypothetical protein
MQGVQVVEHVDVVFGDEGDFGFREFGARAFTIGVTADGGDGGDCFKLLEDGDLAYIAQMEDALDAFEGAENFRAEKAVGVADDADLHSSGASD